jgi:hypothetical protein
MSTNTNFNQRLPVTPMTEDRTKEIIIDTLIELGLITQPQKRKQMSNV